MYSLILNASEGVLQFVIGQDNTVLVHEEWESPKHATEKLAPLLEHAFDFLGLSFKDLNRIACVVGAGSFTGIRLCLSTASALARISQAQQVPIDYLHVLAHNAPQAFGAKIRVLTHAKKNLVHCADFIWKDTLKQNGETRLLSLEESVLCEECPDYVLGSGLHEDLWQGSSACLLAFSARKLNPQVLLNLALSNPYVEQDIEPQYVRSVDAVDNLEVISRNLGNDPIKAMELFNTFK